MSFDISSIKQRTEKAAVKISRRIGDHKVIVDPDILAGLAGDESICAPNPPDAAVRAKSVEDIVHVLQAAEEFEVPVTPRGGGTGKSGGAIPIFGGIVLDTSKMNQILEIDRSNAVAVVEPGVICGFFQTEVEKEGLFYPPDPNSLETCCLGGNAAHNAGGPRAYKYGVTRNYVMELETVFMGGEVLSTGRRTIKSSAGYDLTGTLVGSEGTLGVFSRLRLSLLHRPKHVVTALVLFPDEVSAGRATASITASGLKPGVLEFMDRELVAIVRKSGAEMVPEGTAALILAELDGNYESVLEDELDQLASLSEAEGATNVLTAKHGTDRERLWSARRTLSDAVKSRARHKISEDIAVPRSRIPEMLRALKSLGDENGVLIASYGHAGDGNFHVNVLWDDDGFDPEPTVEGVIRIAVSLGGTISGEHGIGLAKKKYLPFEKTSSQIALMKRTKHLFDPKGLLNPGKIF
jgi:glycolate oxidase